MLLKKLVLEHIQAMSILLHPAILLPLSKAVRHVVAQDGKPLNVCAATKLAKTATQVTFIATEVALQIDALIA